VTARDRVALLHRALEPYDRVLVPVSGGYDSRLLASVAVARGMDVESWTTSPDDGLDTDIDFARYITRELGIPHRIVPQDPARYPEEALWVARRLEYLTSHHAWYAPFAREVHRAGRPVVDGLAGGPLMKNFLISSDAVAAGTGAARREALLASLATGAPHIPVLGDTAREWIDDQVRTAFLQATSMLHGHRAELPLSVLHTRTVRGIARSPLGLAGPEVTPVFPFLHPEFFEAALSVPVSRKEGGRFYREILRAANPPGGRAAVHQRAAAPEPAGAAAVERARGPGVEPPDAGPGGRDPRAPLPPDAGGGRGRAGRAHRIRVVELAVLAARPGALRRLAHRLRGSARRSHPALARGRRRAGRGPARRDRARTGLTGPRAPA